MPVVLFVLLIVLVRIAAAGLIPITYDESYYAVWGSYLDWGYLDHPPGVALLGSFWTFLGNKAIFVRLGPLIASALCMVIVWRIDVMMRPQNHAGHFATILFHGALAGIVGGVLLTPDAAMMLMWAVALHETLAALIKDQRRWLSAGFAIGVGMMAKYMLVLFGLAALLAVATGARQHFRKPWLYAGFVTCLLGFSPHLVWNSANQWAPMKFQLGHGLAGSHSSHAEFASKLPYPSQTPVDGVEVKLAQSLKSKEALEEEKKAKTKRQVAVWLRPILRFGEFVGGQLALWGGLLPLVLVAVWRSRRKINKKLLNEPANALMFWVTAVPLLFFGLIAFFSKVEANWAASYMLGAALILPRLSGFVRLSRAWLNAGLLINIIIVGALTTDVYVKASAHKKNRLTKETHGYQDLAEYLSKRELDPLFADRYQTISMLRFYQGELQIDQWPGVTRESELIRRPAMLSSYTLHQSKPKSFFLLTEGDPPPHFTDYRLQSLEELVDCSDGKIHRKVAVLNEPYTPSCQQKTFHRWLLAQYRRNQQ